MTPDGSMPPKIWFFGSPGLGGYAKEGYLVWINGQPWIYPPDQASLNKTPEDAGAALLDPKQIVEETNNVTGQTYYAYREALPDAP
jgi:hypothetical protein